MQLFDLVVVDTSFFAGAYFMRPVGNATEPIASSTVALTLVQGPVVSEARQVCTAPVEWYVKGR